MKYIEDYFEDIESIILEKFGVRVSTYYKNKLDYIINSKLVFIAVLNHIHPIQSHEYKNVGKFIHLSRSAVQIKLKSIKENIGITSEIKFLIKECLEKYEINQAINITQEYLPIKELLQNHIKVLEKDIKILTKIISSINE